MSANAKAVPTSTVVRAITTPAAILLFRDMRRLLSMCHEERRHFRTKVLTYRTPTPIEMPPAPNVTQLLLAWQAGDHAALDKLLQAIQPELRRIARRHMAGERPGHLLQPTALVNEAYLRLTATKDIQWQGRAHFFAVAAQAM